jgi:hypothetical protein
MGTHCPCEVGACLGWVCRRMSEGRSAQAAGRKDFAAFWSGSVSEQQSDWRASLLVALPPAAAGTPKRTSMGERGGSPPLEKRFKPGSSGGWGATRQGGSGSPPLR